MSLIKFLIILCNIAMSKDKVMLLMGHKQWRECYDKCTAEDLIKNFKTM